MGVFLSEVPLYTREIVVTTLQGVWKKLNPNREKNTFEIFGWDFLIDEDLNVWLIEVPLLFLS